MRETAVRPARLGYRISLRFMAGYLACGVACAAELPPAQLAAIDKAANDTLRLTGVPGASIAIVKDGKIVATRAYGLARLSPATPATPAMPFAIGSVSKQFTAAVILTLVQQGKLHMDDKVAQFFPELTQAKDITIRELLTHTSGYEDFWPEDYFPSIFSKPTTPLALVHEWGEKKLDFPPGTQWQYSNTGYAIAALIAEKAGHAPFFDQLRQDVLTPLAMTTASDYNDHGIPPGGPLGYQRYGFSPPRPAPLDQPGWSFGSGELAMTAHDLALWDISVMNRSLLSPASYKAMETEAMTGMHGGKHTGYGLGVEVGTRNGHRYVAHSGEETGFVSQNVIYPDDHAAVAVLTNQDASRAASLIAASVSRIAFGIDPAATADPKIARVMAMCADLAQGHLDPKLLNANAQSYFTPSVVADYEASLKPLGPVLGVHETASEDRGGMTFHMYEVKYVARPIQITTYDLPDGRLDQFLIVP
jgi:CubicO group peptidase (beta-lactamase class C family)